MNQQDSDYSTQKITPSLISKIIEVLKNKAYGSIEIYIENFKVTQITERTITKLKPKQTNFTVKISANSRFDSKND